MNLFGTKALIACTCCHQETECLIGRIGFPHGMVIEYQLCGRCEDTYADSMHRILAAFYLEIGKAVVDGMKRGHNVG